ncbi:MAG: polysaccharide deacetylase family protein [Acidobacteria bacterium]|nr:polysaccharide deacetylase family protein [Acidobacteriota bacterium]
MNSRGFILSGLFVLASMAGLLAQSKSIAERLGYARDSKLVIVHADDLAVAHSVDVASFDALERARVTSASIMVPCPWITEVAAFARTHPDADLGLHLTLTSEWKTYRWGPVAPRDKVPSLVDPAGALWTDTALVARHARADEAEREIRTQIEQALALGIHPTHLDTHMASAFATPEIFAVYAKVAHEYHLPFLVVRVPEVDDRFLSALSAKDVLLDSVVMATPRTPQNGWKDFYLDALKQLRPGLHEMIVHLGHDDSELEAVTVDHPDYGSAWRQRDYDFVTSPDFKKGLEDNHIVLVRWRDLQKLVNEP